MAVDTETLPPPARAAVALERSEWLDPATTVAERVTAPLGRGPLAGLLSGRWSGHALHPALTDAPLGFFTSAAVLDLVGGPQSQAAAQRLVGLGLLSAVPTAASGWTEWHGSAQRDRRVGLVHAGLNGASIAAYAASWTARRRGRHTAGVALGVVGSVLTGAAAYLGGHLASARGVSTRHPALDDGSTPVDGSTVPGPTASGPSGSPAPRPRADATAVLEVLSAQHGEITRLVQEVHGADADSRGPALHRLFAYLAGHEAVEEVLLHPLATSSAEPGAGAQRVVEEQGAAQQIQRLEELGPDSVVFLQQFGLLEEAVTQHAHAEEHEELPLVLADLGADDAALVVEAFRAQEQAAQHRTGSFAEMLETAKHDVRGLAARS